MILIRTTTITENNTTASGQLVPSGLVSPVNQINDKLITILQQQLEQFANLTVTIKYIGNLITQGNIPTVCIPSCILGIQNPPKEVKGTLDKCSLECGKQLTAILVAYHNKCHEDLLNFSNKTFDNITTEYEDQVPELQSKIKPYQKPNNIITPGNRK